MKFGGSVVSTLRHWFRDGIFRRIFKNAGFMLSGRVTTGLLSLATLTLCARTLGVEQFGILVLVQTFGQVTATLATFQSPQAMIRFGALALQREDTRAFQSLVKFLTAVDACGGVFAVCIGFALAPLIGPHVGWSDEVIRYAQLYSFLVFFTACATPTGVLRLLDRFDLLAIQTTMTPLLRLIGISAAVLLHAPFWGYLLAWFFAQMVGGTTLTVLAWHEMYKKGRLAGMTLDLANLRDSHPGVLRFMVQSNLYSALQILTGHGSTFLIGYLAGPAAAGLYKLGRDVATVLTKPADLLNQSISPEFARLASRDAWHEFSRLILRSASVAAGAGAAMVLLVITIGDIFLTTFFGEAFVGAYAPLVLLVAAAGVAIIGFPLDAALFAMGRASMPLRVSVSVIFLVQLPLLVVLARTYGSAGAGFAVLTGAATTLVTMSLLTFTQLRQRTTPMPEALTA